MKSKFAIKQIFCIPPPYGGISSYVKRLIKCLNDDGISCGGYYSSKNTNFSQKKEPLFDKWSGMDISKFYIKIFKYLFEVAPYKIIHSHLGLKGSIYFFVFSRLLRKKIIITIHNSMIINEYNRFNRINRFFINKLLSNSNITWITVSDEGKNQLSNLPVKVKGEIYVIPAYIPISNSDKISLSPSLINYIKSHKTIITFYGHSFMIYNGKDVYGFKETLQMFSDLIRSGIKDTGLIYCISNELDNSKILDLRQYAKNLGIEDKIYWQLEAINNMEDVWKNTTVYIRPTSTDGDSVAVREVLDSGKNVVASDVCIRPEGTILYKYGNDIDFKLKVIKALKMNSIKADPDWTYYNKMKNIYQNILQKNI